MSSSDYNRSSSSLGDYFEREKLLKQSHHYHGTRGGGTRSFVPASIGTSSPSSNSFIQLRDSAKYSTDKCLPLVLAAIFIFILIFCGFLLIFALREVGHSNIDCRNNEHNAYQMQIRENNEKLNGISDRILNAFSPQRIRHNLQMLSRYSHIAGTIENFQLIQQLQDEYHRLGFEVKRYNYSVMLNYPDFHHGNTIEVEDESSEWWTISRGKGRPLGPSETQREQSDVRQSSWWNAYSANGTATGPLVYCNYGMIDDYDYLIKEGIEVSGTIVLIRHGGISRAEKVRAAESRGALGVILFSDPLHFTSADPAMANVTFPSNVHLPPDDAQRGSVYGSHGDPTTPLFPSLYYVHRQPYHAFEHSFIPRIPVTPIGYGDATRIMASLNGPLVKNSNWRGGLGSSYRLNGSRRFRLSVRSRNTRRTISNLVAVLKGKEEPDNWVLVGNHVDAWSTGAIDPLSGTATQLEMARVLSRLFLNNKPRRTIVFCHWDAEEYGLIGSSEWLEEMKHVLGARAVAYINIDHIAGNVTLDVKSVPLLYRVIVDSAEKIPHPNPAEVSAGRATLLDSWRFYRGKGPIFGDRSIPEIGYPAGGSDYQRFITFLGVPSADLKIESSVGQSYALYHTMYETFWTVDKLLDPEFQAMTAMGRLWAEVTHRLANHIVIPFDPVHFAQSLSSLVHKADAHIRMLNISHRVPGYFDKMEYLKDSIRKLQHISRSIHLEIQDILNGRVEASVVRLAQLNSRLMSMERCLLDPYSHKNHLYQHLVYSPSTHSNHVSFLAVLIDPSINLADAIDNAASESLVEQVQMAVTRLQYAVESVIHLLQI